MAKIPVQFACDGPQCTHIRKETNHWWMIRINEEGSHHQEFPTIILFPWQEKSESDTTLKHLCSHSCVCKYISLWLAKRDRELTRPEIAVNAALAIKREFQRANVTLDPPPSDE